MGKENYLAPGIDQGRAPMPPPRFVEVFGLQVPVDTYYLHRGHTWVKIEDDGLVQVGLDDFAQKVFGPADEVEFPESGGVYFQGHVCLALVRGGRRAKVLAPVDGLIEDINPEVQSQPRLLNQDPYGAGWLFRLRPSNLKYNLPNLQYGEAAVAWMEAEIHRLLGMLESEAGVTLPDGGALIDDISGHFPALAWRRLVQEFLLQDLSRLWKKRS